MFFHWHPISFYRYGDKGKNKIPAKEVNLECVIKVSQNYVAGIAILGK